MKIDILNRHVFRFSDMTSMDVKSTDLGGVDTRLIVFTFSVMMCTF